MTLIHEHNPQGQHRIVLVKEDGTNEAGEWAETRVLATKGKWFANADVGTPLPPGIFTVREASYQVLE